MNVREVVAALSALELPDYKVHASIMLDYDEYGGEVTRIEVDHENRTVDFVADDQ
jgi:hypothetical protein